MSRIKESRRYYQICHESSLPSKSLLPLGCNASHCRSPSLPLQVIAATATRHHSSSLPTRIYKPSPNQEESPCRQFCFYRTWRHCPRSSLLECDFLRWLGVIDHALGAFDFSLSPHSLRNRIVNNHAVAIVFVAPVDTTLCWRTMFNIPPSSSPTERLVSDVGKVPHVDELLFVAPIGTHCCHHCPRVLETPP